MAAPVTPEAAPRETGRSNATAMVLRFMALFGGVQAVGILCSVVRTKLVAVWIGAAGVGLFGIYNSALDTLTSLLQLNLRQSAVRDLAAAPTGAARRRLAAVVSSWGWLLGVAGAVVTLACAPSLSRLSFGDGDHTLGFIALAVAVMVLALASAQGAVFQGLQRYRPLAFGSMWGVIGGLAVSVPLFWWLRIHSIVPSIVAYALCTWGALALYGRSGRKAAPSVAPPKLAEALREGMPMIRLGVYMTVASFATALASYLFMAYLNRTSGTATVGLYQAGFTLANRYTGLVLAALGTEYFTRLSAVSASPWRTHTLVSHETATALLVLVPVVCGFITAQTAVVRLLYNSDFLPMLPFVMWAMVGTVLRALSWCLAFTILARGDGHVYLYTEIASGVVALGLNVWFWELWGMWGLGAAYVAWYGFYTLIIWLVYRRRYGMTLNRGVLWGACGAFAAAAAVALMWTWGGWTAAGALTLVVTALCALLLRRLLRR